MDSAAGGGRVRAGDSVILVLNDRDATRSFAEASAGAAVRLRDVGFSGAALIGQRYGSVWEVQGKGIRAVEDGELVQAGTAAVAAATAETGDIVAAAVADAGDAADAADVDADADGPDNRFLVDSNSSQTLSTAAISLMKAAGAAGGEIIRALVANSSTFAAKTAFSQEKYLLKKQAKYLRRFRILQCSALTVCDAVHSSNPEKICGLRPDSLGALLNGANVQSGCAALVFDGCAGLLAGAVIERMATVGGGDSNSSSGGNRLFLAHEDQRDGPNLFFVHRFNLAHLPHVQRMLIGVKYGELVGWVDSVADATASGERAGACAVTDCAHDAAKQSPPLLSPAHVGLKRCREGPAAKAEVGSEPAGPDGHGIAASGMAAHSVLPTRPLAPVSSSNSAPAIVSAPPLAPALAPAPAAVPANVHAAAPTTFAKVPRASVRTAQFYNPAQLRPWPHPTPQRLALLSLGVDSLVVALSCDPLPLVLAALRYCRPSAALAVFSQDMSCLARLFRRLRQHNLAVNLVLAETWTRELQVLKGRTHPHMQMHAASGFVLTGTVVANPYCALFAPPMSQAALASASQVQVHSQAHADDVRHMRAACALAALCVASPAAYSVGAVLVGRGGGVLATGFSRELEGNTHAEEVCLLKLGARAAVLVEPAKGAAAVTSTAAAAAASGEAAAPTAKAVEEAEEGPWHGATLYSTMEPCGLRLSGKCGCAQRLLAAGVARVVLAVLEPPTFVAQCTGAELLRQGGVRVDRLGDVECERLALAANAHVLPK